MASKSFLRVLGTDDIVVPHHQPAQVNVAQDIIEELRSSPRHDNFAGVKLFSAYKIALHTRYDSLRRLHSASSPTPDRVLAAPRDCEVCKDRAMLCHRHSHAGIRTTSRTAPPWDYAPMRGDLVGGECAAIRGWCTLATHAHELVQRVNYHYGLCASCDSAGGVCQWGNQALPHEWD
jgi:hypothetical protein